LLKVAKRCKKIAKKLSKSCQQFFSIFEKGWKMEEEEKKTTKFEKGQEEKKNTRASQDQVATSSHLVITTQNSQFRKRLHQEKVGSNFYGFSMLF
jgi:hypothetical protein